MLKDIISVFSVDNNNDGEVDSNYMKISLKNQVPVQQTYNSILRPLYNELKHYIYDLLKRQWIVHSATAYTGGSSEKER